MYVGLRADSQTVVVVLLKHLKSSRMLGHASYMYYVYKQDSRTEVEGEKEHFQFIAANDDPKIQCIIYREKLIS